MNQDLSAPPTSHDFEPLPPLPQWPKVIGVISTVLGAFGGVCGGCGVAMLLATPWLMSGNTSAGPLPPTMQPGLGTLVMYGFSLLLSFLLLTCGILTLRRSELGRVLHLVYAILNYPSVAVGLWMAWQQHVAMEQWIRENPTSPYAQGGNFGFMISVVIGIVLGFGYPTFLVIWFGFVKRAPGSMGRIDPVL